MFIIRSVKYSGDRVWEASIAARRRVSCRCNNELTTSRYRWSWWRFVKILCQAFCKSLCPPWRDVPQRWNNPARCSAIWHPTRSGSDHPPGSTWSADRWSGNRNRGLSWRSANLLDDRAHSLGYPWCCDKRCRRKLWRSSRVRSPPPVSHRCSGTWKDYRNFRKYVSYSFF